MHNTLKSAVAVVAIAALLLTGCTARDRAGGRAAADVDILRFAQSFGAVPDQLTTFASTLDRLSHGSLQVAFKERHRDRADAEAATVEDIRKGTVDMAAVGARVFDRLGVTAFQPLLAPMLIDSHDLQAGVFDAGIPSAMLADVESLGVIGIGVLPGPMRKLISSGEPLTTPSSLTGLKVSIGDSALAEQAFSALGATVVSLPGGAALDGVNASEMQLASIWGNHYEAKGARSADGNLNLWPRPLVIIMSSRSWAGLTENQRDMLRRAAAESVGPALGASRDEDTRAIGSLCHAGFALPQLTSDQVAAFGTAFAPVQALLSGKPADAARLAQIRALKTKIAAPPDSATCGEASASASPPATGVASPTSGLSGTYRMVQSSPECPEMATPEPDRLDEIVLDGSRLNAYYYTQFDGLQPKSERLFDNSSTYTVLRDKLTITHDADTIMTMTFAVSGDQLTLSDLKGGCMDRWIMTKKPWTKVK